MVVMTMIMMTMIIMMITMMAMMAMMMMMMMMMLMVMCGGRPIATYPGAIFYTSGYKKTISSRQHPQRWQHIESANSAKSFLDSALAVKPKNCWQRLRRLSPHPQSRFNWTLQVPRRIRHLPPALCVVQPRGTSMLPLSSSAE